MDRTRSFPASEQAERAVLGGLLLDPSALDSLQPLAPEHFYRDHHARLYALLAEHITDPGLEPLDPLAVADHLITTGRSSEFGGLAYVTSLPEQVPVTENLGYYAQLIRDKATRRQAIREAQALLEAAHVGEDVGKTLERHRQRLDELEVPGRKEPSLVEACNSLARDLAAEAAGQRRSFLPTGLLAWDGHPDFGGVVPDGITRIVAASGMGKTSLLNRLVLGMASEGLRVHLHGTETSFQRRVRDLATSLALVDARAWAWAVKRWQETRDRRFAQQLDAWQARYDRALAWLAETPLSVTGSDRRWSVDDMAAHVERLHRKEGLDVVVVDYLQDFRHTPAGGRVGDMVAQTTYASTRLKDLAAVVPVVDGAQRSGEKDGPKINPRPQMTDIQHASRAHQDSEEVYGLYREDYYRDRYGDDWKDQGGRPGHIEVIARKRRNGVLRTLSLPFSGPTKWVGDLLLPWQHDLTEAEAAK